MNSPRQMLTVTDHNRSFIDMTYVYPVVSRRADGVSVGINLNPNNACNWHCAYCQVPDLVRGRAPAIDLARLEAELRGFLADLIHGSWMERHVPEGARVIRDIAFSGNGEATTAEVFPEAVALVLRLHDEFGLSAQAVPVR
ncbi:MAG: radical SAM protein, partial [Gemmatimonadetes bacterium]|nr:radical SAM protein [Gemmatimonadota bacterium]